MSTTVTAPPKKFRSYVPDNTDMPEFTLRAVLLGLVLTVILGAANAYLGLRAGMTIAATYPAAVIGMALLRLMRGSLLEENITRTVGSIGESVAAGAIFTIPAFVISGAWPVFDFEHAYLKSSIADAGGRSAGHSFRHPAAPRDGGGSRSSLSRVGSGIGDPQGRTARQQGRKDPVLAIWASAAWSTCWASSTCSVRAEISSSASANFGKSFVRMGRSGHCAEIDRGRSDLSLRSCHQSRVSWRGIHHRPAAGVAELRRRRHRVGPAGAADLSFWAARAWWRNSLPPARSSPTTPSGQARPLQCGASSCGRSRSAACWWVPVTRCSECARAWAPAWRARSPT